jgi:hypothetical protein
MKEIKRLVELMGLGALRSPDENNLPANREEGIRQELENRD